MVTRSKLQSNISFWLLRNVIFDSIDARPILHGSCFANFIFRLCTGETTYTNCIGSQNRLWHSAEGQPKFRKSLSLVTKIWRSLSWGGGNLSHQVLIVKKIPWQTPLQPIENIIDRPSTYVCVWRGGAVCHVDTFQGSTFLLWNIWYLLIYMVIALFLFQIYQFLQNQQEIVDSWYVWFFTLVVVNNGKSYT